MTPLTTQHIRLLNLLNQSVNDAYSVREDLAELPNPDLGHLIDEEERDVFVGPVGESGFDRVSVMTGENGYLWTLTCEGPEERELQIEPSLDWGPLLGHITDSLVKDLQELAAAIARGDSSETTKGNRAEPEPIPAREFDFYVNLKNRSGETEFVHKRDGSVECKLLDGEQVDLRFPPLPNSSQGFPLHLAGLPQYPVYDWTMESKESG